MGQRSGCPPSDCLTGRAAGRARLRLFGVIRALGGEPRGSSGSRGCRWWLPTGSATDLTITVTGLREEATHRLRCDPPGGDLPRATAVCDAIAQHRDLFLNPPPNRSICIGGPVPPGISITGRYQDDEVEVVGRVVTWPMGLGLR